MLLWMRRCVLVVVLLAGAGCTLGIPEVTPTIAPSATPSPSPTVLPTVVVVLPSITPSPSPSPSATLTATLTATATDDPTATATLTSTPTATATDDPTATATLTSTPSPTATATATATDDPTATATLTSTPSPTATATATATDDPTATATLTSTPSPTATATDDPTATATLTSTPTAAPTDDPTATATPTSTPSPTATDDPTATATPTSTPSPTATATATDDPTATATLTSTPSPTATGTPSPVPTASATASATQTSTATASATAPPSATPTQTFTPSATPTATLTARDIVATLRPTVTRTLRDRELTPVVSPTATPTLTDAQLARFATPTATATPFRLPQVALLPTLTPPPPPTIAATPTFITATPNVFLPTPTPGGPVVDVLPATLPPQQATGTPVPAPTFTPVPLPTVAIVPEEIPPTLVALPTLLPLPSNSGLFAYAISTSGGLVAGAFDTGGSTRLFAQNPTDPNVFALVDAAGKLFVGPLGSAGGLSGGPFTAFTYQVSTRDENNAAVGDIAWSNDGKLAWTIDAGREAFDGVWYLAPVGPVQLLRDCPRDGHPGCNLVLADGRDAFQWRTVGLRWAPPIVDALGGVNRDADVLLALLDLPAEGRRGFVLLVPSRDNASVLPRVYRYESAHWSTDGGLVVVSGRGPDGAWSIGLLPRDGGEVQTLLRGDAFGLFPRAAVQLRDGTIVAFASEGTPDGPVRLVNGLTGAPLSPFIGASAPQRISWAEDRTAALVVVDGRTVLVGANGQLSDITPNVTGIPAVGFVPGPLPDAALNPAPPGATGGVPSGVVAGSRYAAGQQLRVVAPSGINLRAGPGLGNPLVGGVISGGAVAVLAGPAAADGYTWWQVKAADGTIGWLVERIGDADTLAPA